MLRPKDPETVLNRRQLIAGAGALIAAHADFSQTMASPTYVIGGAPRLLALRLACAAPLAEMRDFYHGKLGLPLIFDDTNQLILGGDTRITFEPARPADGKPFYHFAFNIPENKVLLAREWQLKRTRIIPPPEHLRDSAFPDDIVAFRHWKAHSIFFWDPAGNLVEYIARHDLANATPGPFTGTDLLYASEIGIVVDDVDTVAAELATTFQLQPYRGGSSAFRAIGDEGGLLLAMKRGRLQGFGEGRPAGIYPVEARIRASVAAQYRPHGLPYEIVA